MLKKRKSQGLPINIIIIAVLVLVVLVVLITIFSEKTGESVRILESCNGRGGDCIDGDECRDGETEMSQGKCGGNEVCCIKVFKENE
jgi:uncharacterized membrane protein YqiK|tara:strand:- start:2643 stop:2903 length:261 start_codon:yes stop_codon:yes gene_type:complete